MEDRDDADGRGLLGFTKANEDREGLEGKRMLGSGFIRVYVVTFTPVYSGLLRFGLVWSGLVWFGLGES